MKRKQTEQQEFDVIVKDTTPGAKQPMKTTRVSSTDAGAAVDDAVGNDPTIGTDSVSVEPADDKKTNPHTGGVVENVKINVRETTESLSFPYTMFLPKQFASVLDEAKASSIPVGSGLQVTFETKSRMVAVLRKLNKMENVKANAILTGLRESLE